MRNWGKEIKDVGVLVIIVSIVVLILAIYTLFGGNEIASAMFGNSFFGMIISGLIGIVTGIVLRSFGKSKMAKDGATEQKQSQIN